MIPAAAVAVLASLHRHDSAGLLSAAGWSAVGAVLASIQVSSLSRRYGGLRPSAHHLGEAVQFAAGRPRLGIAVTPLATATVVAAMFLATADAGQGRDRTGYALVLFAGVCALWIGFDTIAAILTGRWERATGLRLYCRDGGWLRGAPMHLAVEVAAPVRVRRRLPFTIAVCGLALIVLVCVDVHTLIVREAPWQRHLPIMATVTAASHVDPNLSAAATTLAGHRAEVRCWSAPDWAAILRASGRNDVGFANQSTWRIQLAPSVCAPLMALRYGHVEPPAAAAGALSFAVVVLGHEAGHLAVGSNESAAECFGLRAARRTALMLGADPPYAALLQAIYRETIYPRRGAIYRAGGCPAAGT